MQWRIGMGMVLWVLWCGTAGAVGRLVDVEVVERATQRALPVHQHHGRYYVAGQPGQEYQVRVRNRGGGDVLTVVSVDGVNAVSGETAHWSQTGYVLGPHQVFDVRGWRKSLERIAAFYFTDHASAYATRTGRPDHVGVIGVAVFRRQAEPQAYLPWWRQGAPDAQSQEYERGAGATADAARRRAEAPAAASPYAESNALGTGHGRSEASHASYTEFRRATAAPEEVVAIHYDSHANLVAQGIIRGPRLAQPQPFPGRFVPDPR